MAILSQRRCGLRIGVEFWSSSLGLKFKPYTPKLFEHSNHLKTKVLLETFQSFNPLLHLWNLPRLRRTLKSSPKSQELKRKIIKETETPKVIGFKQWSLSFTNKLATPYSQCLAHSHTGHLARNAISEMALEVISEASECYLVLVQISSTNRAAMP